MLNFYILIFILFIVIYLIYLAHKGKIGYKRIKEKVELEFREERCFCEQSYNNLKAMAYEENDLPCSESSLEEINNWSFKTQIPFNKNIPHIVPTCPDSFVWEEKVEKDLIEFQKNNSFDFLKKNFSTANFWEPISSETQFGNFNFYFIYNFNF